MRWCWWQKVKYVTNNWELSPTFAHLEVVFLWSCFSIPFFRNVLRVKIIFFIASIVEIFENDFYTRHSKMSFLIVQYYLIANDGHKYFSFGWRNSQYWKDWASWTWQQTKFSCILNVFWTSIFLFSLRHSPRRFHFAFEWRNLFSIKNS